MALFSLQDKVAIVTGGAKGIGEGICTAFGQQGAIVHLIDVDVENGIKVEHAIKAAGGRAFFHECDLTDHDRVGEVFQFIYDQGNTLDILVNNAAIAFVGSVETTTPEDMDRLYSANIKSVYSCLHHGVKHMKASGGGAIVNMASVAAVVGVTDRFAYSMSKGAVYTMTFSIAKDYLKDNIRCNSVGPGRIHTPFVDGFIKKNYPGREEEMFKKLSITQPIGRMGKPIEIAHIVVYLCSDEAEFVTGTFFPIDGGYLTLNP